jgi:hypothetical protein
MIPSSKLSKAKTAIFQLVFARHSASDISQGRLQCFLPDSSNFGSSDNSFEYSFQKSSTAQKISVTLPLASIFISIVFLYIAITKIQRIYEILAFFIFPLSKTHFINFFSLTGIFRKKNRITKNIRCISIRKYGVLYMCFSV